MSIFINNEIKQNTLGYWFGLATPILIGWGCSLFSLAVLMTRDTPVNETSYVDYFLMTLWVSGHLVLYPLCAWWLILRGKKLANVPCIKGAYLSIKLYMIYLLYLGVSIISSVILGV